MPNIDAKAALVVELAQTANFLADERRRRAPLTCFGRTVVAGLAVWTMVFAWWMFAGSGYATLSPTAYRTTTTMLLALPTTATEATALIERDGYISLVESKRLMQQAAY